MLPTKQVDESARRYRWKTPIILPFNKEVGTNRPLNEAVSSRNVTDEGKSAQLKRHKTSAKKLEIHPKQNTSSDYQSSLPDIGTFVKTYVDWRTELDFTDLSNSVSPNQRRSLRERKASWSKYLSPLRFDKDEMFYRLEEKRVPVVSFRDVDMMGIYRYGEPSRVLAGNKTRLAPREPKPALATKHWPCLPAIDPRKGSARQFHAKKRFYTAGKVLEEKEWPSVTNTKAADQWERHVLGLVSRQTAQWIANECSSSAAQRQRLVHFLDDKYFEHYLREGGAAKVTKIIDVDDDIICWPVKRKTHLD